MLNNEVSRNSTFNIRYLIFNILYENTTTPPPAHRRHTCAILQRQ
jgi:hypothetical protein